MPLPPLVFCAAAAPDTLSSALLLVLCAAAAPDSPGPAEYQDASYSPQGPAYTMAGRPAEREDAGDLPAPGDYDVGGKQGVGRVPLGVGRGVLQTHCEHMPFFGRLALGLSRRHRPLSLMRASTAERTHSLRQYMRMTRARDRGRACRPGMWHVTLLCGRGPGQLQHPLNASCTGWRALPLVPHICS